MLSSHVAPVARARHAHQLLRASGEIPAAGLPDRIGLSWRRCLGHGLSTESVPDIDPDRHARLAMARERNRAMMRGALPVIEALYEQIVDTQSMVVLTDASGFILHSRGDDRFLDRAKRVALAPGVDWSEQRKGTNAIGTALMERAPVVVNGPEHYLTANHFLTCSAAPILDPKGEAIGVLDVTGDYRGFNQHTMALVKMSVQMIENHLLATAFPEAVEVRIHSRPEFLGTLCEGILAFDADGACIAANRSACFQLGKPLEELRRSRFEALFNQLQVRAVVDHALLRGEELLKLTMHNGVKVVARVRLGAAVRRPRVFTYPCAEEAPRARAGAPDNRPPRSSLALLDSGDRQLAATLDKLRRVIGWDIPVLIHGETGTGKELLARAIHEDGPRRKAPFVAVNCAAIPEGLIESELFGYEEGAFTGARRKGAVGRILQADGGTLFLDEIGDMPLALQARLLRVLQERVVTPLGGVGAHPVNISLICATHRKLKECVAAGAFRADLYYRLNGLCVTLPPLRLRSDLRVLIDRILEQESRGRPVPTVAAGLMALFERHPWPGNIRQLANLLRTALVMAAGEPELREEHLPQDFWDELPGEPARDADAAPVAAASTPASIEADLASLTRQAIERALDQNHGNMSAAARQLGISRNTLYRRLPRAAH
jgi:sigma-54 dependent transcriptional regulator, acetoin dehydrogenase operon transcriptional activator AcoR